MLFNFLGYTTFGDLMESILRRAALMSGIDYGEFSNEIKKAMRLVGCDNMSETEFITMLVTKAVEGFYYE